MLEALLIALALEGAKAIGQLLKDTTLEEVSEKVKLVRGFKDNLKKLQEKFSNLQLFLHDVGSANHADKRAQVINWLVEVKDAGYVADDIIDDYHYETIRREREENMASKVTTIVSGNNHLLFRTRMSDRVGKALDEFDRLSKEAHDMGLKPLEMTADRMAGKSANNVEGKDVLSEARRYAGVEAAEFVGREDEVKTLLEIMRSPSENNEADISTVVIHGIGGLGKTTFARRLSQSKEATFDEKFWISVGQDFNILRILNEMHQSFLSHIRDLTNEGAIIKKLKENLDHKKYLLVLDDVWCQNEGSWSSLKNELEKIEGLPGCLILITARFAEVAKKSKAVYEHPLRALSEGEGWALLKQRVLVDETSKFPNFEKFGKKIVAKCKGVPLAIKAIGSMLQWKKHLHEWESIEKSEIWEWPINDENLILPSLRLTYDHLPSSSLKQCFAYCPAFCRKGDLMKKDELVDIWLAQGFLHDEKKKKTMEEIGEEYLMDLQNYSLLDEVKGGYKMHDLVYDLAVDVCGKDLLFWKLEDHHKIYSCRHLVIDKKNVEALSKHCITEPLKPLNKLRTISGGLPDNVLDQAKYLRTLSVDGCGIEELPSSIGLLTHLRFLGLSRNKIKTLPDSIKKLYLLQTLRLLGCSDMKDLPEILSRLINLIHIRTTTPMFASQGLRKLTKLRTLPRLALRDDKDGWTIDELGDLKNLMGEIHISGLEHVKTKANATKADLAEKAKVSNITLAWAKERKEISGESNDVDVLDGLQPHPNITSLELQNFFGRTLPSWMVNMEVVSKGSSSSLLKDLTSFKLLNCSRCQMLPTLGHLPSLKYLVLSGFKVESIGNVFYGVLPNESNELFPSLIKLEIFNFGSLKTWVLPSTGEKTIVFCHLEVAKIVDCPELETIPALDFQIHLKTLQLHNVGIQSLKITNQNPSSMLLETLDICKCEKLVSVPEELQYVAALKKLKLYQCPALTSLPIDLFEGLTSLSNLYIYKCEALKNIPTSLEKCASLAMLKIEDCPSIEDAELDFSKLQGLRRLYKSGLPIKLMKSMLEAVKHLPNLTTLITGGFSEEEQESYFSDVSPILQNQSLHTLLLNGHPDIKSLPEKLQELINIKVLTIYNFGALEELPGWVGCLSSLEALWLYKCEKLKEIPSKKVFLKMTQLRRLYIWECPILAECVKDDGFMSKISHISFIEIR